MSSPSSLSILLLGASGFVGGELLISLAKELPTYPITALIRNATPEKVSFLRGLHPGLVPIEGDLSDSELLEREVAKADVVINVAAALDVPSLNATLKGLSTRSQTNPSNPPIYIHMYGTALAADYARGNLIMPQKIWRDIGFKLSDSRDPRVVSAFQGVVDKNKDEKARVRSIVVMPGQIYGLHKVSPGYLAIANLAKSIGQASTVGPGRNVMNDIHVKDVASAVTTLLKAAIDGKADEGEEGFYWVISNHLAHMGEVTRTIGDALHKHGIIPHGGSKPLPQSVVDSMGIAADLFGSSSFCLAERLAKFGWSAVHSEKESVYEALEETVEVIVKELEAKK